MANSRGRGRGGRNQYGGDSSYASDSSWQASQGSPYGRGSQSQGATGGYGSGGRQGDPYDSYDSYGGSGQDAQDPYVAPSPYDDAGWAPSSQQDPSGAASSPYGSPYDAYDATSRQGGDPYARTSAGRGGSRSRGSRSSAGTGAQPAGRVYGEGRGTAYTSTRPSAATGTNRAAGVRPVTRNEYVPGLGASGTVSKGLTRRQLVAGGCAIGLVALLGIGGITWWTHRAVACEVNGTQRNVPVDTTAEELIKRGYASPQAGNLVSIGDDANPSEVVEGGKGMGNPYTLVVNGEQVDLASYRVKDGDQIEFQNGTDVVEETTKQETRTPCGVQFCKADGTLIDPNEATSGGIYLSPIGCVKQWGKEGVETVETGTVSGRVIDHGVTQEAQDLVIAAMHVNPAGEAPMIALTFDDGPADPYTGQYLDILARYGARATFFNLGQNAETYPELCKRCVDEGHQVASHTYSHANLPLLSVDEMKSEIAKAYDAIEGACGVRPTAIRPPYGEFYCKQFLQTLGEMTYSAYWTVDSQDWAEGIAGMGQAGADKIVANCTGKLSGSNYNGAIILMHDGGGDRSADVLALPTLIETFQAQGYQFVTMDELIKADPTIPAWVGGGDPSIPADASTPDLSAYI